MSAKPQTKKRRTTNKSIQTFLGLLILVNLVGFLTFALVQNQHQSEFNRFQSEINQKNQLFERIHRQLGFGEMIHSFKNLVIRGEQDYRTQSYSRSVQDNIDQILTAIRTYRQFDSLSEAEKTGLNGVEEVVRNYQKMLPRVLSLQGKGVGISEIDRQVVVDDRPAMKGMETWQKYLIASSEKKVRALQNRSQTTLLMHLAIVMLVSVMLVLMAFEIFVQRALVRPILNLNRQIEPFFRGDKEVVLDWNLSVEGAQEVQALEKSLKDAFALKRANRKELAAQVEARTRELSETKNQLKSQKRLLETLWKAGNMFMIHRNLSQVAGYLLHEVLALTQSEYGFIGEVLKDEQGAPFLKIHEMTDLSWNEETRELYEKSLAEGFEFRNLNTLFGRAILTRERVISDDPATDPRSGGLPEGHPALSSFLGVPFFYGSELVGMYGLANRPGGYEDALVDYLEPFTQNYGALIFVKRMLAQQEKVLEELARERNAAERANRAKSEFLSSMSHELRTPLNSVLGFTQLLNYDGTLGEEQKESLNEIEKAGKHLLDLIDDVLDLSKVESGNIELTLEPVALSGVVEESSRLIRPAADQFEVVLQVEPCEPVFVRADRVRLKQVLLNLLSNAVKYNVKGGRVTLKVEEAEQSGSVLIHIEDSGIGIKEGRRDQLFQPFNRLGLEGGTIEGSGVGLSITKTLVELMGGEINYTPNSPQGSCFTVTLKAEQPVEAFPEKPLKSTEKRDKPAPDVRKTILYIEDNPANLKLVAQILSRYECIKLLSAPTGELGIEQARRQTPDLILLDINMPEVDGYQTLKALRQLPGLANTPVFALTACSMLEEKERAEQTGFDDFITKPIEVEAFLAAVSQAFDV